ncbi:MAG: hypothetical protein IPM42_01140 [Saprospiraceae bacterium]|nr:hypothetical protein [Saprospiraceae bacterium]
MKILVTYFLAFLVLLPILSKVNTILAWKVNQEYIANYLCENKDKKELKCKGKCQLMKNLKDSDSTSDNPLPPVYKDFNFQPFIPVDLIWLVFGNLFLPNTKNVINYNKLFKNYLFNQTIYIPPDLLSHIV